MPETKLPEWLAEIEEHAENRAAVQPDAVDVRDKRRLLELAKAQHEALATGFNGRRIDRARRLWEDGE